MLDFGPAFVATRKHFESSSTVDTESYTLNDQLIGGEIIIIEINVLHFYLKWTFIMAAVGFVKRFEF